MRKVILILIITQMFFLRCTSSEDDIEANDDALTEWTCGTHNGNTLWTGPRGGCYYYNSNNNKTYVDRSECNNC